MDPRKRKARNQRNVVMESTGFLIRLCRNNHVSIVPDVISFPPSPVPPAPHPEEGKSEELELDQSKLDYSLEIVGENTTDVAVAAAESTAAQVSNHTASTKFAGKSREVVAAIKIQTAFRGYLARRALRALRGLVRLKSLVQGNAVERQATTTLRCLQTLARVQSQIRSRRIHMLEETKALQCQLLLKRERELENIQMSEEWDDSIQSKEHIEAGLLSKQEAKIRRERALAYAFSHQWKNSSRFANLSYMDPNNPHWGWSWLERWMAAKPWESNSNATDREHNSELTSMKSTNGGEVVKVHARDDTSLNRTVAATPNRLSHPTSRRSLETSRTKVSLSGASKINTASPRSCQAPSDDDTRSMISIQSEKPRRYSIAGSSVRDDESLASSPSIPSYMVPTESARAKNRLKSPLGDGMIESPEKSSVGSVMKRLSFPASAVAGRRHSSPPTVDTLLM